MSETRKDLVTDERLLRNVREARACGFDFACSECGCGIEDDSDAHDSLCSRNPERDAYLARAEAWAARQREAATS